ncbi:hypothetical protein ACQKP0_17945 [Heyndrickxia sp. NPDC080065]|uniref:hypothetical protein n=1 Tax=Heyndrickxia sp. NPDC080065 TaxID=3390568 RepID=UPI003D02DCC3
MKRKKKSLAAIFIICTLIFLAYLNGKTENDLSNVHTSIPVFNDEQEETTEEGVNPIFEYKFIDSKKEDGYVIETYREYEVYKDRNGTVIKTIPTKNYNYLKYKITEKQDESN